MQMKLTQSVNINNITHLVSDTDSELVEFIVACNSEFCFNDTDNKY